MDFWASRFQALLIGSTHGFGEQWFIGNGKTLYQLSLLSTNFHTKTVFLKFLRLQMEFQFRSNTAGLKISSIFIVYVRVLLTIKKCQHKWKVVTGQTFKRLVSLTIIFKYQEEIETKLQNYFSLASLFYWETSRSHFHWYEWRAMSALSLLSATTQECGGD